MTNIHDEDYYNTIILEAQHETFIDDTDDWAFDEARDEATIDEFLSEAPF